VNRITCLVQADGPSSDERAELEDRLLVHHRGFYPDREVSIRWSEVAPGFMFTAGEQSNTSAISCSVDGPTTLDLREAYMRGICDLWTDVTGCTDHDVLVSLSEATA